MSRISPCFYIAPSAISIIANANGSANDLAVNVAKGAQIRVFSNGISGLNMMENSTWQQWTFSGRNRSLGDSTTPYTIYVRLAKNDKSNGYLIFAAQVADGDKWLDKYAYVTMNGLATGTANKNNDKYWYIKLGYVSLPQSGKRTVSLETGILGTDQFNREWNLSPDELPLRIELSVTIDGGDAGDKPYVPWGKEVLLSAKLVEGWLDTAVECFHHYTIQRNTGDEKADLAYNYPSVENDNPLPSSGRQLTNDNIVLSHARGEGDVFDGAVSSTWTVIAWGVKENAESNSSSSSRLSSKSSSSSSNSPTEDYEPLAQTTINIMAETVEQFALELSSVVVNYDPPSDTYNPEKGVDVMVRATDQKGNVFKLTKAQVDANSLAIQYQVGDNNWNTCNITGDESEVAKANIPVDAFHLLKTVIVRIVKVWKDDGTSTSSSTRTENKYTEIYRIPIAIVRNGEDTKEREWIYFRSRSVLVFTDDTNAKDMPLLPARITMGEVNPEEAATGVTDIKDQDGWVPEGWYDEMHGTDKDMHYEYAAFRDYTDTSDATQRSGHWGEFSTPRIWSYYAEDAVTYRCRWTLAGVEVYQLKCAYTGAFRGTLPLVATLMKRVGSGQEQMVTGETIAIVSCEGTDGKQIFSKTFKMSNPSINIDIDNGETNDFIQYLNNVNLQALSITFTIDDEDHYFSIPVIREADEDSVKDTINTYGSKQFLSKVIPDTAHEHIDFEKGATVKQLLESDNAQSENYIHTGFPFGKGWGAMRNDGNGASMLEVDKLYVRMKAIFAELEIRKISYVGGNYLFSAAGSKVYYVEWLDANGNILEQTEDNKSLVNTYRCYMYTDDGTTSTLNYFKAGDQVRCQTFDVARDSDNAIKNGDGFITATAASSRYWWRKVNAIGQGKIAAKGDDTEYQYVDFLNIAGDYAVGSDIPEVGDAMVQFGSWTDAERDGAILIVVVGDMSPAIVQYMGICDAANGGSKHFVAPEAYTRICANPKYGNIIRGKFISIADSSSDTGRNDGESVDDIINGLIDRINDIQNQADKKFELWFNSGAPHPNSASDTETNAPASNWLTESEKALHAQDLYYDTDKAPASQGGRAWRYTAHDVTDDDTTSIVYYWDEVTDQDTINALEKAADLQAQNSLAALAEKVYDISGGYIKSNDNGYIKVSLETDAVDGEGNILYKDGALSRCVKDASDSKLKWENIDNDTYKDTFLGAYQAVGSRTITVYKSKPTEGANNYDLILRWVDWYDTFKEENITDGNLEILMYSNGIWRMLRESTHAVVENLGNELRSIVYGTDDNGMFASGIRSLKNMNTMFSQYEEDGGLVTKAQLSTRIDFDPETGKAKGFVDLSADEIIFKGKTIINDKFWVDTDGNVHMNNATIGGDFVSGVDGSSKVIIKKDENGNAYLAFQRSGIDYIRFGYNDKLEVAGLDESYKNLTQGAYMLMGNWHGAQTDFGFFSRSWSQTMVMTTEATHADVFYHSSPITIDLGGRYTLPGLSAAFNGGIKVGTIICDASSEIIINLGSPSDTENKYRWLWIIHKSSAHVTFESDGNNMYMGSSKRGVSQWVVETLGLIGLIYSDGTCWYGNYMNGQ